MVMMSVYRFRWTASYMGVSDYEAVGDGPVYTATLRREASDYEKSVYKDSRFPISQEVVDAFNAWRQATHEADVKLIRDHPEKYGPYADNDPLLAGPTPARGAHYQVGTGWVVLPEDPAEGKRRGAKMLRRAIVREQ